MPHAAALDAVFFDVGNTLLYPYPSVAEVVRQILEAEGHAHELDAIEPWMPLVDEYYEDRYREDDTFWTDEGETSSVWVGMYSVLMRRLGIDEDAERLAGLVYEEFGRPDRWRAFDDVRPSFERLRACGLRLGIISNWDRRLESLMDGLGLGELVECVVSSAAVGLHKPDPRIFELACERIGVRPEAAAHVGDHQYADVLGAVTVGMRAVLIDRLGGPRPESAHGEPFVRTLDELEDALGIRCEGARDDLQ